MLTFITEPNSPPLLRTYAKRVCSYCSPSSTCRREVRTPGRRPQRPSAATVRQPLIPVMTATGLGRSNRGMTCGLVAPARPVLGSTWETVQIPRQLLVSSLPVRDSAPLRKRCRAQSLDDYIRGERRVSTHPVMCAIRADIVELRSLVLKWNPFLTQCFATALPSH